MTRQAGLYGLIGLALLGSAATAHGEPALRVQVQQRGDFAIIGNTLGHDCVPITPPPVVGFVGDCGPYVNDPWPDVFWRADSPVAGNAEANVGVSVGQARSTAVLALPPDATVTHAFLYWGAFLPGQADTSVRVRLPDYTSAVVNSIHSYYDGNNSTYQSVADVTQLVQSAGQGFYQISDVGAPDVTAAAPSYYVAWWLVVFYQQDTASPHKLALFDGFDWVTPFAPANASLTGFLVPKDVDAKLAVVAFEGNHLYTGDSLLVNGVAVTDAVNPADDFFNASRSYLGVPASAPGDLPRLTGGPGSMSAVDIDVVDITQLVSPGMSSLPIGATATVDWYWLGGFVLSISSVTPEFIHSEMIALDLNGGALLPGDTVEYAVVVPNTGNDTSLSTWLSDTLPIEVSYVPGSLEITAGPNAGAKTDTPGDDQAEYDAGAHTVIVRLGTDADAMQGGKLIVNEWTTVVFRVTVNPGAFGVVSNQGLVLADGEYASPGDVNALTDGNGSAPGSPPTDVVVSECEDDAQCFATLPFCSVTMAPQSCVECLQDLHCPTAPCFAKSTCDPTFHYCIGGDPLPDTLMCDDKNDCTKDDKCSSGICVGTTVQCPKPDQCHEEPFCNPQGGCPAPVPSPDDVPCDDGNKCTQADRCASGVCIGLPVSCPDYPGCDKQSTCDTQSGQCAFTLEPKADGDACDDGDPCTESDHCGQGACRGVPKSGGGCDDGDACTVNDQCDTGVCRGIPRSCAPYACNQASGECKSACATISDCALGKVCDPYRHCVDTLPRGGSLEGSCAHSPPGTASPGPAAPAMLSLIMLGALAARRRRPSRG